MERGQVSKPPTQRRKIQKMRPAESKQYTYFRKEIVMKRAFAIILALVLMLSLTVPVFAAEDGSIVITNATIGDTYRLYKIFEATFVPDGDDQDENPDAVSYTLTDSDIYEYMFGEDAENVTVDTVNGTRSNGLFIYTDATKQIKKIEGLGNAAIFAYLATMVRTLDPNGTKYDRVAENVTSSTVEFNGLSYGYYLIDKKAENGLDVAVTITSTTPTANVIDKNQKPASEFGKLVWDEDLVWTDENGVEQTGKWVTNTSANVGDILEFKVEFDATNYDGEQRIEYYSVMDTKGAALWVEFDKITVTVDGKVLTKGYYHGVSGTHNTGEWKWLGEGWEGIADADRDYNDAEWYLVHYGYDKFEIVIPWLTNHKFTGTSNGFTLTYGDENEEIEGESEETVVTSRYKSPVNVTVEYIASVEPGASIGAPEDNNLWNTATLTWNPTTTTPPDPSTTHTTVYALGLYKYDSDVSATTSLANAEFGLFRDEACQVPVYVIPTGIPGVYILDDLNTEVSGSKRETARKTYEEYLEAYLGPNYATTQKNIMRTEVNGKIVILGLEAGDYYLKETDAPDGYNILSKPEKVTVGQNNGSFFVITDEEGKNVFDTTQVAEGYKKHEWIATSVSVGNSKGVQLPSTGGEGTLMMITIGSVVAMGFAVLLITQKKMSIYND